MEINILEIDSRVRTMCARPEQNAVIESYRDLTFWFNNYLRQKTTVDEYNFYLIETIDLLGKYEEELKRPAQIHFFRRQISDADTEITKIAQAYLYILSRLARRFDFLVSFSRKIKPTLCLCPNPELVAEDNEFFTCCFNCGERFELGHIAANYGDSKRLSLSQKNPNDKRHHFSDCIDKFQGVQKGEFPDGFFSDIEKRLQSYDLLSAASTRFERFSKVRKDHIKLILKDMGAYKQYKEDLNVIYKILTEKPLPDINYLKNRLLKDFVIFDEQYNHLFSKTKKAAYHYYLILFQLLYSYGIHFDRSHFNFLKTADRKSQHDQKYKQVFDHLNWNYYSIM